VEVAGGFMLQGYVCCMALLEWILWHILEWIANHDSVEMVDIRCCLYAIYILLSFVVRGYLVARESLFHHS
jgi:hypothetical protein